MSPASPQPSAAGRLVYHQDAEASSASDTSTLEVYSDSSKELLIEASDSKGESMYVTLFEGVLFPSILLRWKYVTYRETLIARC